MADWREQEARNEARFREQNEWIEATETSYGATEPLMRFVCECGDAACTQTIELTMVEYEYVRGAANRFAVAPNHENPEAEVIVSEHARFTVVDKITGPGLEIARETDPRVSAPLPDAPLPDAPVPDAPHAATIVTRPIGGPARWAAEAASRYRLVNERIRALVSGEGCEHEDSQEQTGVI